MFSPCSVNHHPAGICQELPLSKAGDWQRVRVGVGLGGIILSGRMKELAAEVGSRIPCQIQMDDDLLNCDPIAPPQPQAGAIRASAFTDHLGIKSQNDCLRSFIHFHSWDFYSCANPNNNLHPTPPREAMTQPFCKGRISSLRLYLTTLFWVGCLYIYLYLFYRSF